MEQTLRDDLAGLRCRPYWTRRLIACLGELRGTGIGNDDHPPALALGSLARHIVGGAEFVMAMRTAKGNRHGPTSCKDGSQSRAERESAVQGNVNRRAVVEAQGGLLPVTRDGANEGQGRLLPVPDQRRRDALSAGVAEQSDVCCLLPLVRDA